MQMKLWEVLTFGKELVNRQVQEPGCDGERPVQAAIWGGTF